MTNKNPPAACISESRLHPDGQHAAQHVPDLGHLPAVLRDHVLQLLALLQYPLHLPPADPAPLVTTAHVVLPLLRPLLPVFVLLPLGLAAVPARAGLLELNLVLVPDLGLAPETTPPRRGGRRRPHGVDDRVAEPAALLLLLLLGRRLLPVARRALAGAPRAAAVLLVVLMTMVQQVVVVVGLLGQEGVGAVEGGAGRGRLRDRFRGVEVGTGPGLRRGWRGMVGMMVVVVVVVDRWSRWVVGGRGGLGVVEDVVALLGGAGGYAGVDLDEVAVVAEGEGSLACNQLD